QSIVTVGTSLHVDWAGFIIKSDQYGNIIWSKDYSNSKQSSFRKIRKTDDNGYIILGFGRDTRYGSSFFQLLKIDSIGNVEWSKSYNNKSSTSCIPENIKQLSDGSYVICGTYVQGRMLRYVFVTRVDVNGKIIWDNVYEDVNDVLKLGVSYNLDLAEDVANKKIVLVGNYPNNYGHQQTSGLIFTISTDKGTPLSTKAFSLSFGGVYRNIFPIKNGFLVACGDYSGRTYNTFFKISSEGNFYNLIQVMQDYHVYSDGGYTPGPVVPTRDGGIAFITNNIYDSFWNVTKINASGGLVSSYKYPKAADVSFVDIKNSGNGGFIVLAKATYNNKPVLEMIKIDSLEDIGSGCPKTSNAVTFTTPAFTIDSTINLSIHLQKKFSPSDLITTVNVLNSSLQILCESTAVFDKSKADNPRNITATVFPNPATDKFSVLLNDKKIIASITVYNQFGNMVIRKKVNNNSIIISRNEVGGKPGIYFINIQGSDGSFIKKEVKIL
ncbi:MAG: T9SS type A sorting domain-containing protein, partial [Panacibacter sp.]